MKNLSITIAFLLLSSIVFCQKTADTTLIVQHMTKMTKSSVARSYQNIEQLNTIATYIHDQFRKYTPTVSYQEFEVNGVTYRNVIASFGPPEAERIIVGAHYDVYDTLQGADDNATGVTGILELARMLQGEPLNNRIDLVAFTLEEPPFFKTKAMGSYQHASNLIYDNVKVKGMICLEMIGYFSDDKHSQGYPMNFLSLFYGKKGDYITLVKKMSSQSFVKQFCKQFIRSKAIKTKRFSAPASVTGVDFSDHYNYWLFNIPALMITDTAFFRNHNYHKMTDTMETLDFHRMAKVIDATFYALMQLQK